VEITKITRKESDARRSGDKNFKEIYVQGQEERYIKHISNDWT
jgi:hypothetical protein